MPQAFSVLHNLDWAKGSRILWAAFLLMTAVDLHGQTFTQLHSFDGTDGALPDAGLVQASDGNLYGTTAYGGANCVPNGGCGTVFKITLNGELTTLYSFCAQSGCTDGSSPQAGLVQTRDGNLYGTTPNGGTNCVSNGGCGTVFRVTSEGEVTTLYSFCAQSGCTDGSYPYAGLVQATNGKLYGATLFGGAHNQGTIFEMTENGVLKTLFSFDSTGGSNPYAALIQARDGNFYGTTVAGGKFNYGTIFRITPGGTITRLYSFCEQRSCADGQTPQTPLVEAANGDFYGTTNIGGTQGGGVVFKITPEGKFNRLFSFCSEAFCSEGSLPMAPLIQATDGNLYGTTSLGKSGYGTVFKIAPSGQLTYPYVFAGPPDGIQPLAPLVQDTNGAFYGTTYYGGPQSLGTIFSLSAGLKPFVETLPTVGKDGVTVTILGTNLRGASEVNFNGTAATFTVVSATEIETTVPNSATTGFVTVSDPSGTLKSNKIFRVIPQLSGISPHSGPVGSSVIIKGISLKQTTTVTFGGVPATSFTVDSDTQVTAIVPNGAKTGKITVTTPGGTATSPGTFTVT